MPELWPPWHSSFTHCVLTEVCTSRVKKIKLYIYSHKFLYSWLRWMVPQKFKGPDKGDSNLFLFTFSPERVWWPCPRCVSTETLGLVEGPAFSYLLLSEVKLTNSLWQSGELRGCLLPEQPSTDLGCAGKTTPNNFLLSGAPNPKIFLFRKWGGVAFGFISLIIQQWSVSPLKKKIILFWNAAVMWKPALSRRCTEYVPKHKHMHKYICTHL